MPLGSRELLMIIRARDVSSRVLREVGTNVAGIGAAGAITGQQMMNLGSALTGVGVALGAAGALGLSFFNDATNAAMDYNKEAALTKTQVDQVGVSVKDLADIGRRVAREIPAPFDQMQASLYDIFSSMDVNVMEAEGLLTGFSKSAVAGQVDIQTAARSTISILNAYQRPVGDVNKLMDIQFQLVRKGVGTYEEFNSSLGRAVPAAVAAGQNFETLAGIMAFLTRNGLSTQMAATSAARAFELFSEPKKFKALEDLGVTVRDSSGNFLQLNDIVTQLANNEGWARMTEPARKQMFEDIFGKGSIQARRFFDTAIPNFQQLNGLTQSMYDSSGAMEAAYGTMFDEPAMKAQLLKNRYEVLKTEIGDQLIPVKVELMEKILELVDRWNELDDSTRETIVWVGVIGSALLVVVGVILTVMGVIAMLIGSLMLLGASLGGAIAIITVVPLVILAIGAAIAAIIIYWDTLVGWVKTAWEWFTNLSSVMRILIAVGAQVGLAIAAIFFPITGLVAAIIGLVAIGVTLWKNWDTIKEVASDLWQMMQDFWDWLTQNAVKIWHDLQEAAEGAWMGIQVGLTIALAYLQIAWNWIYKNFGAPFMKFWNNTWKQVGDVLEEVGETIGAFVEYIINGFQIFGPVIIAVLSALVGFVLQVVMPAFMLFMDFWINVVGRVLWEVIEFAFGLVITIIEFSIGVIMAAWNAWGEGLVDLVISAWNAIFAIISAVITFISNFLQLFMNIIQGDWGEAWENVKNIFKAAWDAIWAALQFVWALIKAFFIALPMGLVSFIGDVAMLLWNKGKDILTGLWNGAKDAWRDIADWLGDLDDKVKSWFDGAVDWLIGAGKDIIEGLWEGMKAAWESVSDWLGGLDDWITDLKGPPAHDKTILVRNGQLIMEGLKTGLQTGWKDVAMWLGTVGPQIQSGVTAQLGVDDYFGKPPPDAGTGAGYGPRGGSGIYIENLNVSDENVVNDMDWWWATTGAGM